ncbi:uncharacterized protein ASCRUDRAFT_75115 [Ascoidea rubescens DSM 1968]|uniref:Uncharacterized protein n=1 Tax=Ascoidea rubescens DSM 1968 TaxID=1344418 RepID=A0A1D2VJP6_9ASCO|nr:hypothetical protein ASCRUDRAFT_75115 [Ascoidea rubescens DSM 1968]ODV61844.1 hypothetical protein ASCRUDRAFT_75115 [Ascoidea rubescens DSM 1968]
MKVQFMLVVLLSIASCYAYQSYCRCQCNSDDNYLLMEITDELKNDILKSNEQLKASDPSLTFTEDFKKDCSFCSKKLCKESVDKDGNTICKKTVINEIVINCFERESLKDQVVIYSFIIITIVLLIWALLSRNM